MVCPHYQSSQLRNLNRRTELGYAVFRCGACRRKFNERTGTPFNFLELPTDIVFEILFCRLRYNLSLRDVPEMYLLRGFEFIHEAVRDWEERFAPLLAERMRRKRKGKVGLRWYVDKTLWFANNPSGYKLLCCKTFITVVESAQLRNCNDHSFAERLSGKWTLLTEAQMCSRSMVIAEITR